MTHEKAVCPPRMGALASRLAKRRIDAALVFGEANIRALAGIACDNGCLLVTASGAFCFVTDFRYAPMAHRLAPWLETLCLPAGASFASVLRKRLPSRARRIGYEGTMCVSRFLDLQKNFKLAKWVDVSGEMDALRAVKTPGEIEKIIHAAVLNDEIWRASRKDIRPGMTEKDIQRVIRSYMNALGDGEAFETIVCAGPHAAECHHVPDETPWRRGEPLLVDMGVKLDGVCSDMTRNIVPRGVSAEYARVYAAVREANEAAIAAVRPGITCGELDARARRVLRRYRLDKAFGHALGHGVGYEIHEAPVLRAGSETVLSPGMLVTIEPGVYLEGRLGVRIEDLVLVTREGCEVLTQSPK